MSKTNIQFNYLYRDAGNYKAYGREVFSNPNDVTIAEIDSRIRASLFDEQFFNPSLWRIKRLEIAQWDDELDHDWHEYRSVELTMASTTNAQSISDLMHLIKING